MRTWRQPLIALVVLMLVPLGGLYSSPAPKNSAGKQSALLWLDQNQERLTRISLQFWEFAETALQEYRSAALLVDTLKKEGFSVQQGVAGMPTAFIATYGQGKPLIGLLAEYDALPGLSQQAAAKQEPVLAGAPGHGCGHNLFGSACLGAALAVKQAMEAQRLPGTLKLFGCPAEETVVGKTYMARDGVFNDLDAAIAWHPGDRTAVTTGSSQALNNFKVSFFGRTAHAAADPWLGRSALDAAELMNVGVNYLREHMPPTARVHYVYLDGGRAPNIVPDTAQLWYYVREKDRPSVEELYDRVLKIAQGAALMTGTTYRVDFVTGVHNYLPNSAGDRLLDENLKRVGPPRFSPAEVDFAKALQTAMGKPATGLRTGIEPLGSGGEFVGGSTDVAEVSWITPTVQLTSACAPADIPWHSWGVTASSGHSLGQRGMLVAAKAMALTALDFLRQPKLLAAMREEFQKETRGQPYRSPLPAGQMLELPKSDKR